MGSFLLTDMADEGSPRSLAGGQAATRRWRPPGYEEGTTRSSFIDIPRAALPPAAPSRSAARSSGGAETGSSRMMLAPAPDVTAQLGRLMTEGAGLAHTCPSWIGRVTSRGSGGCSSPCWMDRCSERRQLHYRDPSVSLLSPVIENHVKGQLCGTGCPCLYAVPFSQNRTKTTLTG